MKRRLAPSNGTTSTPPKLVVTLPPNHSTLQWHPAMAPRPLPQWHPAMAPRPLPQNWLSPLPQPRMAPCNAQLWHHVHSPKVGRHHAPQP